MGSFLLLDATDQALTLCWTREDADVKVEEVQMRKAGQGMEEEEWTTLSSSLSSSALRKNKLSPATSYQFRRRPRQNAQAGSEQASEQASEDQVHPSQGLPRQEGVLTSGSPEAVADDRRLGDSQTSEFAHSLPYSKRKGSDASVGGMREWGPWSEPSPPLRTLASGTRQAAAPAVKLRESGAVVMEWPAIEGAKGYEIQMSSGEDWATIAPCFSSSLLRKKGLEDTKQYRFRVRPVFDRSTGAGDGDAWYWSPASALASPAVLNSFLKSQLPRELVLKGKQVVSTAALAGKIVAFYFSASWCGPCRKYTPQLAALYNKAKAQHKAFEVVFVSLDSDEESMARYHAGMPWLAIPFDEPFREEFPNSKGVNSIPRLIVTGRRGQELSSNAVGMTWEQLLAWDAQG